MHLSVSIFSGVWFVLGMCLSNIDGQGMGIKIDRGEGGGTQSVGSGCIGREGSASHDVCRFPFAPKDSPHALFITAVEC
jgi:hypothetical protein